MSDSTEVPAKSACATTAAKAHPALGEMLTNCVHCGFCLAVCPTYQMTGDENNSPRGRLRLWREEAEGRLAPDPFTAHYTSECVGCLACEPACPANVPYGDILEQVRHQHVFDARTRPGFTLRAAAAISKKQNLFNLIMMPVRMLRSVGILPHRFLFAGRPPLMEATASYARRLMDIYRPTGPRVALLTGCLMESVFREINFATVRVLIENDIQVVVPPDQGCCGAFQEHLGLDGIDQQRDQNRKAFGSSSVEAIVCNSSGCGLALGKTLNGQIPVRDVLEFLGDRELVRRTRTEKDARVYLDLPCHFVHGQRQDGIPASVLDATGYRWELAPMARDCCGSGGIYNIQKPENAQEILRRKSEFLNTAEGSPIILATSNHVCMMQWNSAKSAGLVNRPYSVKHVIQLLDPGEGAKIR